MDQSKSNRRDFLKAAAGVLGAAATCGMSAKSYASVMGANDRVRVGVVGFGSHSRQTLLPAFQKYAPQLNFELTAVSDIWNQRRAAGVEFLTDLSGRAVMGARNTEELYDLHTADAVIIATPDFQHAAQCIEAVEAGCHVYIETPMAHSLSDAQAVLRAVQKSGRIVQIGSHCRSAEHCLQAKQLANTSKLMKLRLAELNAYTALADHAARRKLASSIREADTDWRRFQMNFTDAAWDPRKYVEHQSFWPYSAGLPVEAMLHRLDALQRVTGHSYPGSIVANGGNYRLHDGRSTYDTVTAVCDYQPTDIVPGSFTAACTARETLDVNHVKEVYHVENGVLNLEGAKSPAAGVEIATQSHMRDWMESIRSGKQPNADVQSGFHQTVTLCMLMTALETGKRVTYDAGKREVITI